MVELDAIKTELVTYEAPLAEMKLSLALDVKAERVQELEREMEAPGFWDDTERSQIYMRELKGAMRIFRHYWRWGMKRMMPLWWMISARNL